MDAVKQTFSIFPVTKGKIKNKINILKVTKLTHLIGRQIPR